MNKVKAKKTYRKWSDNEINEILLLKNAIKDNGKKWTQLDIAKEYNTGRGTISKIWNGKMVTSDKRKEAYLARKKREKELDEMKKTMSKNEINLKLFQKLSESKRTLSKETIIQIIRMRKTPIASQKIADDIGNGATLDKVKNIFSGKQSFDTDFFEGTDMTYDEYQTLMEGNRRNIKKTVPTGGRFKRSDYSNMNKELIIKVLRMRNTSLSSKEIAMDIGDGIEPEHVANLFRKGRVVDEQFFEGTSMSYEEYLALFKKRRPYSNNRTKIPKEIIIEILRTRKGTESAIVIAKKFTDRIAEMLPEDECFTISPDQINYIHNKKKFPPKFFEDTDMTYEEYQELKKGRRNASKK